MSSDVKKPQNKHTHTYAQTDKSLNCTYTRGRLKHSLNIFYMFSRMFTIYGAVLMVFYIYNARFGIIFEKNMLLYKKIYYLLHIVDIYKRMHSVKFIRMYFYLFLSSVRLGIISFLLLILTLESLLVLSKTSAMHRKMCINIYI